ncbi:MAG: carbohydrate kinase family protein, partial [bacterium]
MLDENKMKKYDVYSYGVISSSTLYLLKDQFLQKSGYSEIIKKYKNIGGEAANASISLARLGLKVKLNGNWINPDNDAIFLKEIFRKNKIDISRILFRKCQSPKEALIVDSDSRTILGTYSKLLKSKKWNIPKKEDIENAKIICLDPFFGKESLKVAEYAKKFHKPIVTIDCKFNSSIFRLSSAAIISEEYLKDNYPKQKISKMADKYLKNSAGTVILTFGYKKILYSSKGKKYKGFTPFKIKSIDTTGAGDSFRAGIIYGILKKWPIEKTIKFSSALAAIVCQTIPGVLNSPNRDKILKFIEKYN